MKTGFSETPFYQHARIGGDVDSLVDGGLNDYGRPTLRDEYGGRLHSIPPSKVPETQFAVVALFKGDGTIPFSPVADVVKVKDVWYSYERIFSEADRQVIRQFPHVYAVGRMLQAFLCGDTDFYSAFTKEKNTHRDIRERELALTYDFEQAYYGVGRPITYAFEDSHFRSWYINRSRAELHAALQTLKHMLAYYATDDGLSIVRGVESATGLPIDKLFHLSDSGRTVRTPEQFRTYLCDKIAQTIGLIEAGPSVVHHFQPTRGMGR